MKQILLVLANLLVISLLAFADADCDVRIIDPASVLKGRDWERIDTGSQELWKLGAEFYILATELKENESLATRVSALAMSCRSWQEETVPPGPFTSGYPKRRLIVLAIAPEAGKASVFFGDGWNSALQNHYQQIVDEIMPQVREKDFARAAVAAEQAIANRVQSAGYDRDYVPIYIALGGAGVLGSVLVITFLADARARRKEMETVRMRALETRQNAAEGLALARRKFLEYDALEGKRTKEVETLINETVERYAKLDGSSRMDPTNLDLAREDYETIHIEFLGLAEKSEAALGIMSADLAEDQVQPSQQMI